MMGDHMPPLIAFLIAYAGVSGKSAGKIDDQVHAMVAKQTKVVEIKLSSKQHRALVAHSRSAEGIVRDLDIDGLIAGEVERTHHGAKLKVVVYGSDGVLIDLIEVPIGKKRVKKISRSDLRSLRGTMKPDLERLTAPAPKADDESEPVAEVAADTPKPEPAPAPPPPAARKQEPDKEPAPKVVAAAGEDDEVPDLGTSASATPAARPSRRRRDDFLRVALGGGVFVRRFEPGPAMALAYRSAVVPAAQLTAELRPIRYLALSAHVERTVVMYSALQGDDVPTSSLGWQATAALRLPLGALELAALGGIGARQFAIDSAEAPTPDQDYLYAVAGGQLMLRLGSRLELRAFGAFEPVVGGTDTMTPAGSARSGFAGGASLTVGATSHVFFVLDGSYQRFTSTFDDGAAVDEYPIATLGVGAKY